MVFFLPAAAPTLSRSPCPSTRAPRWTTTPGRRWWAGRRGRRPRWGRRRRSWSGSSTTGQKSTPARSRLSGTPDTFPSKRPLPGARAHTHTHFNTENRFLINNKNPVPQVRPLRPHLLLRLGGRPAVLRAAAERANGRGRKRRPTRCKLKKVDQSLVN